MENLRDDSEERLTVVAAKGADPPVPEQHKPMEEEGEKAAVDIAEQKGRDEDVEGRAKTESANEADVDQDEAKDAEDDYYNSTSSALSEDRWEEMWARLLEFKVGFDVPPSSKSRRSCDAYLRSLLSIASSRRFTDTPLCRIDTRRTFNWERGVSYDRRPCVVPLWFMWLTYFPPCAPSVSSAQELQVVGSQQYQNDALDFGTSPETHGLQGRQSLASLAVSVVIGRSETYFTLLLALFP
jgi:hypothetical protein